MPASPISYALPLRENLESDEDWSRISDRKIKKRVQNRVAQREYRRRMRERIEVLTAELDEYRRRTHEPLGHNVGSNTIQQGEQAQSLPQSEQQLQHQQQQQQDAQDRPQQQHQPHYEQHGVSNNQQQQYAQNQRLHFDSQDILSRTNNVNAYIPSSTISPSLLQTSVLTPGVRKPEEYQDATITSTPGTTRLPPHAGYDTQHSIVPIDKAQHTPVMEASHGLNNNQESNTFPQADSIDDESETFDVPDNISTLLTGHSPPRAKNVPVPDTRTKGQLNATCEASQNHANIWDQLPGAQDGLEEQFEFLLNWAQHAGFRSLDDLLEIWYTGDFNPASPLRQEQRLSRHRGLTTLLAKLRASTRWSKWERWGYQEETLQGAENILRLEFSSMIQSAELGQHVAALQDRENSVAAKALKRHLQDNLPQLRTLLTAVTVDSGKAGRRANRKAIDAATMVLSMAGRVPDADLVVMLQNILQSSDGGSSNTS